MKKLFTLMLFATLSVQLSFGQCDIANNSFENWTTDLLSVEGPGGTVSADAMLPDSTTSFLRFFLMGFGAAFDQSIAQIVEDDPQGFLGISQSSDATDGDFAVQLQGGYDLTLADIYSPNDCAEVPDTFYIDVKVQNTNGIVPDSLFITMLFDEGLAPVPSEAEDVLDSPAGVFVEFVYPSDTAYHTLAIPIIKNFEAPVDTMYYIIGATTHDDSYILIDNLRFENGGNNTPNVTVRINEIESEQGYVELYNYGNEDVEREGLYLHYDGDVYDVASISALCSFGSSIIAQGDYDAYRISSGGINNESGEMVLATSATLTEASQMVDYLQWGSGGQQYEELAIEAGLWTAGEFETAFFATGSLEYDEDNSSNGDWENAAVQSLCFVNGSGCDVTDGVEVEIDPDYNLCLCDDIPEPYFLSVVSGLTGMNNMHIIIDDMDNILYLNEFDVFEFDDDFCVDGPIRYTLVSYDGEISGLEVGSNLADLYGCYTLSDPLELQTTFIEEFDFQIINGFEPVEGNAFEVCLLDDIVEIFTFEFNTVQSFTVLILDENDIIVDQFSNQTSTTFENLLPGEYTIGILQHTGMLDDLIGQVVDNIFFSSECIRPSNNSYELTVLDIGDTCTTATQDPELLTAIQIFENPVSDELKILLEGLPDQKNLTIQISEVNGQILRSENILSSEGLLSYDISSLSSGVYFVSIHSTLGQATRKFVKI